MSARRPLVGVGVVLFRRESVLLVRRARAPLLGRWSFPGGRQELGETVEAAGRRELREETGLEAGPLLLAGHVDAITRDEAGGIEFHYTILDLAGFALGDAEPVPADDVSEARFVPLGDLERVGLERVGLERVGLDGSHRAMVALARRRLAES